MDNKEMENIKKESNQVKYDAFISYRHTEVDQFVAEQLHKMMETFKLPSNVAKKNRKENKKTKITRVFRDQDELQLVSNLEDPIIEALNHSEWLIVICSPRLRQSMWCLKEIETFIKLHGRDHVMAVLVEGEPEESFPEQLLYRDVLVQGEDGLNKVVREQVEPLAADIRGADNAERLKKMKGEILRLLAPMFELNYDDLRQRHKERRMRRIMLVTAGVALIGAAFGLVSTFSAISLDKQNKMIQAQSEQILEQSGQIEEQNKQLKVEQAKQMAITSQAYFEKDEIELAIRTAYDALNSEGEQDVPYTDEARYALTCALQPYSYDSSIRAKWQIDLASIPKQMSMSPEGTMAVVLDAADVCSIIDVKRGKVIDRIPNFSEEYSASREVLAVNENTIVCAHGDNLVAYNVYDKTEKVFLTHDSFMFYSQYTYDKNADCIIVYYEEFDEGNAIRHVMAYDTENFNEIFSLERCNNYASSYYIDYMNIDHYQMIGDDYFALGLSNSTDISDADCVLQIYDVKSGELVFESEIEENTFVKDVDIRDGKVYAVGHYYDSVFKFTSKSKVRAWDMKTGQKLWEREESGASFDKLFLITDEEEKLFVAIISDTAIIEIDAVDGNVTSQQYNGKILWSAATDKLVGYITADSQYMYLYNHLNYGLSGTIDFTIFDPTLCEKGENGYLIAGDNGNRVVFYAVQNSPDALPYDGELQQPDNKYYEGASAKDLAKKIGLEKYSMVDSIAFDDENKTICTTYNDFRIVIFDAETYEELGSWDKKFPQVHSVVYYRGKDKEGNMYWGSDTRTFCISPNYKLLAYLDYLVKVDVENNVYIFDNYAEKWTIPIYTFDEIMEMAEEKLNQ